MGGVQFDLDLNILQEFNILIFLTSQLEEAYTDNNTKSSVNLQPEIGSFLLNFSGPISRSIVDSVHRIA